MELILMDMVTRNIGSIIITSAVPTTDGDIAIKFCDQSGTVSKITSTSITGAYLTEANLSWGLVLWVDDNKETEQGDNLIFDIVNQDDVYRLQGFLIGNRLFADISHTM